MAHLGKTSLVMTRRWILYLASALMPVLFWGQLCLAEEAAGKTPVELFTAALAQAVSVIEPASGTTGRVFSAQVEIVRADGLSKDLMGHSLSLAVQAPDHLRLSGALGDQTFQLGRRGQQLWIYVPGKQFGAIGVTGIPRFASAPDQKDQARLAPFKLPLPRDQVLLLPLLMQIQSGPSEPFEGQPCHVLHLTPQPAAIEAFKLPRAEWDLWLRQSDLLPVRLGYTAEPGIRVQVNLNRVQLTDRAPDGDWDLKAKDQDHIETVALSHLKRFIPVALSRFMEQIPTLGPATGERQVVAAEGQGRLEMIDGTRVLFLKGTPEEMGRQHGVLLRQEIRDTINHILYGVGVGSSFAKGRWFFAEIESAQNRLVPHMNPRYLREMDAMASAAGVEPEEARLANYFPELFHCSGFAVMGEATEGGRLYHGRILDYLRGAGLEQNAVVMVVQPDQGNAWVNISYAGFVGSVTAMNEKHLAIGEMGGRGEGHWDGKPMAQLVREVMENAGTLDEAVEILRRGPRTCEYYYVVSDAKSHGAVGVAATPETFEIIGLGQSHPRLPQAIKDVVLMSAGERYETLAERVRRQYGKLNAESARELMTRPVAMNSNLHSVLFAPDTLDFWVAQADSHNVASHTRYTHYNLAELLRGQF